MHYLTAHYILVIAAFIVALLAAFQWIASPRVNLFAMAFALFMLSLLVGCASPAGPHVDNAATRTGENLVGVVATVMQDYADVKEGGVNSLWSISKGLNAYGQVTKTTADIKQLIVDWKATKGDSSFIQRILDTLNKSDAPAPVKAAVVAKAAEMVAVNKNP